MGAKIRILEPSLKFRLPPLVLDQVIPLNICPARQSRRRRRTSLAQPRSPAFDSWYAILCEKSTAEHSVSPGSGDQPTGRGTCKRA
jgi:hypothetical protein